MTFCESSTKTHFSHFFVSFLTFALVLIEGRSTLRLVMLYAITLPSPSLFTTTAFAVRSARIARLRSFLDTEGNIRLSRTMELIARHFNEAPAFYGNLSLWVDDETHLFCGKHKHEAQALVDFLDHEGTLRLSRDLRFLLAEIFIRQDWLSDYERAMDI
jgi:hypothetical protein